MVKTAHFHDRGCGFNPWSGNQIPTSARCSKERERDSFASSRTPWVLEHFLFLVLKAYLKGRVTVLNTDADFDITFASDKKITTRVTSTDSIMYQFIDT